MDRRAIADAVARLLADPAQARAMGEAGRRRSRERFGYECFRMSLLEALELT